MKCPQCGNTHEFPLTINHETQQAVCRCGVCDHEMTAELLEALNKFLHTLEQSKPKPQTFDGEAGTYSDWKCWGCKPAN